MKILGIDASIRSSGLTIMEIDDDFEIVNFNMIGFTDTKKWRLSNKYLEIMALPDDYDSHPYHHRAKFIVSIIQPFIQDISYVSIEDYALGAKGNVFDIAEFTGTLKEYFYCNNIPLKKLPPTSVKEFATGSGASDKIGMWAGFQALGLSQDVYESVAVLEDYKSPQSDLIDSFHMANLLRCELSYLDKQEFPKKIVPKTQFMTESIVKKSKKVKSLPTIEHGFLTFNGYKRISKPKKKSTKEVK